MIRIGVRREILRRPTPHRSVNPKTGEVRFGSPRMRTLTRSRHYGKSTPKRSRPNKAPGSGPRSPKTKPPTKRGPPRISPSSTSNVNSRNADRERTHKEQGCLGRRPRQLDPIPQVQQPITRGGRMTGPFADPNRETVSLSAGSLQLRRYGRMMSTFAAYTPWYGSGALGAAWSRQRAQRRGERRGPRAWARSVLARHRGRCGPRDRVDGRGGPSER